MKTIPLSQGKFAKVSDHRFERVAQFGSWFYCNGYARCNVKTAGGWATVFMHHLILPKKEGFCVDHIDGDGTNNQDDNLRYVTSSQSNQNMCRRRDNTSGVPGVSLDRARGKWTAFINLNGERVWTKRFDTFEEAVEAREKWKAELFGETACQNPERGPTVPNRVRDRRPIVDKHLSEFMESTENGEMLSEFF